jgi:hypothetical protein
MMEDDPYRPPTAEEYEVELQRVLGDAAMRTNFLDALMEYFIATQLVEAGISDYVGMEEHNRRVMRVRASIEQLYGRKLYHP